MRKLSPNESNSLRSCESCLWIESLKPDFKPIAGDDDEDDDNKEVAKMQEIRRNVSKTHMVVATLIATVGFAAAFQIPGGYQSGDGDKKGMAMLAGEAAFGAFVISDVMALSCSVLILLLHFFADIFNPRFGPKVGVILISSWLLPIAIIAMIVAFMCGVFAVLVRTHFLGIGIVTVLVCFIATFIGCIWGSSASAFG